MAEQAYFLKSSLLLGIIVLLLETRAPYKRFNIINLTW